MTTAKRTFKPKPVTHAPAKSKPATETPVLYYTGTGSKLTVPPRNLFAADMRKRSKEALIATGLYSETKPEDPA